MAFIRKGPAVAAAEDPEQLYRRLAQTNSGPEALWGHQVDLLRSWYENYRHVPDVALELPTGAGKTLVGGLIGEWRRQAKGDRVAYVCPTRQLARQTAEKLSDYGIPSVLLIGKVRQWNQADRAKYTSGRAVAVTVYSHVFNSNPAIDDAQLLLLDDAHAAEQAVAAPWSMKIERKDPAYLDVLAVLGDALDPLVVDRLRTDTPDRKYTSMVYLASPAGVAARGADLERVVDEEGSGRLSDDARFAAGTMAGKLDRCMVYVAYREILIRPLVAPTATHVAFASPARRVYMSATLGAGGELERAFGRSVIARIPVPKGWDKQGTGRRFFCFPELTTDLSQVPSDVPAWTQAMVARHGRVVVLTPDRRTAGDFEKAYLPVGYRILTGHDVEDDLALFTGNEKAALSLSNRYDGIDLPNEDCRLVVLSGLPARGDLQERFLYGSLGALEVLQERVRARIVQGAGRATRNSRDFAAVLVFGADLTSYLTRADVLRSLREEIQAELAFGLENSLALTSAEMTENLSIFAEHGEDWRGVEGEITVSRDGLDRVDPAGAAELQKAAPYESAAWQAVWQGDWPRALDQARRVTDALRGGRAPQRYAALWHYLASCWALRLAAQTGDADGGLARASAGYFSDAKASGRGTTWLAHLAAPTDLSPDSGSAPMDPIDLVAARGIIANMAKAGRPGMFNELVAQTRSGLLVTDATSYEAALVNLGILAGASEWTGNAGATAAPDATWIFESEIWILWEAKSDAKPDGELGAGDVRQAGGHIRFAADQRGVAAPGGSVALLMTPQARVHPSARAVAEEHVFLVRRDQVVGLCDSLVRAWNAIRATNKGTSAAESIVEALRLEAALPTQWLNALTKEPLRVSEAED